MKPNQSLLAISPLCSIDITDVLNDANVGVEALVPEGYILYIIDQNYLRLYVMRFVKYFSLMLNRILSATQIRQCDG